MAFSIVQGKSNPSGGSVTLTSTVASGNMLCVSVLSSAGSATVSDDKSNSYTPVDNFNCSVFAAFFLQTFYLLNITNGPSVITASGGGTLDAIAAEEFSGVGLTLDGHIAAASATGGTGTDAVTTGNWATSTNGDLIWAILWGSSGSASAGTSYVLGDIQDSTNEIFTEWKTQATSSATTVSTFTQANSGGYAIAGMAFTAPPPFALSGQRLIFI